MQSTWVTVSEFGFIKFVLLFFPLFLMLPETSKEPLTVIRLGVFSLTLLHTLCFLHLLFLTQAPPLGHSHHGASSSARPPPVSLWSFSVKHNFSCGGAFPVWNSQAAPQREKWSPVTPSLQTCVFQGQEVFLPPPLSGQAQDILEGIPELFIYRYFHSLKNGKHSIKSTLLATVRWSGQETAWFFRWPVIPKPQSHWCSLCQGEATRPLLPLACALKQASLSLNPAVIWEKNSKAYVHPYCLSHASQASALLYLLQQT